MYLGEWQPKIHVIDFNKVREIKRSKIKEIPVNEKARLKSCHIHIDPALYDGQYALGQHQMFIALVIWLVNSLKQRNRN